MTHPIKPTPIPCTDRWENEGGPAHPPEMLSARHGPSKLEEYGIERVQLTVFEWGGYRYSSSKDAIAAASRAAAKGSK